MDCLDLLKSQYRSERYKGVELFSELRAYPLEPILLFLFPSACLEE